MKANELMIGDWVSCNRKHYQIAEIGKVVRIDWENELFAALEDIKPVKLTAAMLKRNGFQLPVYGTEDEWSYEIGDGKFIDAEVRMSPDEEGGHLWVADIVGHDGTTLQLLLDYVHELQHAIRLCGIDKDIVL